MPERPTVRDEWLNASFRIARFKQSAVNTYYGGDDFPYLETHLGPGTLATFLGARPDFQENTVWYYPMYADITKAAEPCYNPDNPYWSFVQQLAREGVAQLRGRALVGIPDLIEGLDTLASLRGTQELLIDLIDHPSDVHRLLSAITDVYFDYYDRLHEIIRDDDGGSCFAAFRIWGPGKVAKVQCDFSAMISPEMFAEYVVPYLRRQCARLDYSMFHLDGPSCICHLDLLLDIPELDAIQWTPGAGQPGTGDRCWYPLYERVLSRGKALEVAGCHPDLVKPLIREFGPDGLMITTRVDSIEAAERLVEECRRL